MAKTFREFVMRGNVLDLAVAVILGAAFTRVVNALVDDVIMPPVGLLLGDVDFTNLFIVLKEGTQAAIAYGAFLNTIVTFLIVAGVVFWLVRAAGRVAPALRAAVNAVPLD